MAELPSEGEAPVIVSLSSAAMHMYTATIDSLPPPEDPAFHDRAEVVLSGLRKLQSALAEAARMSRTTASVIVALSEVRSRYNDLMAVAAAAPGATLGQQLYVARKRAHLSAREAANGAGLRKDLLDDLEAGEIPTEEEAAKIRELIAALGNSPDFGLTAHPQQADPGVNGAEDINGWHEPADEHAGV
jgi:hypothetical protein